MKKLLAILGSTATIISAAASVVSCGGSNSQKAEKDVLFLIPGTACSATSKIYLAYQQLVDNFNAQDSSDVKIDLEWETDDAVANRIASDQQLPDLYVSYPDSVSMYKYGSEKSNVRDMGESIGEDEKTLKSEMLSDSFYDEGTIDGELDVLSTLKSFDYTTLNLSLLVEMVTKTDSNLGSKLKSNIDNYNKITRKNSLYNTSSSGKDTLYDELSYTKRHIFTDTATIDTDTATVIKNLFSSIPSDDVDGTKTIQLIRDVFMKNENVLSFVDAYQQLYNNGNNVNATDIADKTKMYAIGVDDLANRYYTNVADSKETYGSINTETSDDFLYKINNYNYEDSTANMNLNKSNAQSATNFFNELENKISVSNKSESDVNKVWSGVAIAGKLDGKTYSSSYFTSGSMLLTSGSSAGTYAYTQQYNKNYDVEKCDVLSISDSTETGNKSEFLEQGPGIAGFKSIGSNADEKEKVVTQFLKFMMDPTNLNELAIQSGYMPSTKTAANRYEHYIDGDWDNVNGEWREGVDTSAIEDKDTYEQIANSLTSSADAHYSTTDPLLAGIMDDYLNNSESNSNFVTTTANPLGSVIREGINDSIKNYIMKSPDKYKFDALFDASGNYSLKYQITSNAPGDFSEITVNIK